MQKKTVPVIRRVNAARALHDPVGQKWAYCSGMYIIHALIPIPRRFSGTHAIPNPVPGFIWFIFIRLEDEGV